MQEREPTQVSAHTVNTSAIYAPHPLPILTNIFTAAAAKLRQNAHGTDLDLDLIKSTIRRFKCWSKYREGRAAKETVAMEVRRRGMGRGEGGWVTCGPGSNWE